MDRDNVQIHKEFNQQISEENAKRVDAINSSNDMLELLTKTVEPISNFTQEEIENYEYYKTKVAEFETDFNQRFAKQFVWGAKPEKEWPADSRRKWLESRIYRKEDCFYDFATKDMIKDEKFVSGANVARQVEVSGDVMEKAAKFIRDKQEAYNKMSAVGRFFSYLNPFKNEYRSTRKLISIMKDMLIKDSKCDKKELEDYVNGKNDKILFEKGMVCTYQNLTYAVTNGKEYQLFGDNIPSDLFEKEFSKKIADDIKKDEPEQEAEIEKQKDAVQPEIEKRKDNL